MAWSVWNSRGLLLSTRLTKDLKHMAVDQGKLMNALFEEALVDLLKKYLRKVPA